jgi:hypothetical protein
MSHGLKDGALCRLVSYTKIEGLDFIFVGPKREVDGVLVVVVVCTSSRFDML